MNAETTLRLIAEIEADLAALRRIKERVDRARSRFAVEPPDEFELGGVGSTLHDFYCTGENTFKRIAVELNSGLPAGGDWHVQLLRDMMLPLPEARPAVIRDTTGNLLKEYLDFRHVFRHTYGFDLRWERIRDLLDRFDEAYQPLVADIEGFVGFLREMTPDA